MAPVAAIFHLLYFRYGVRPSICGLWGPLANSRDATKFYKKSEIKPCIKGIGSLDCYYVAGYIELYLCKCDLEIRGNYDVIRKLLGFYV